jgi:predicted enzyme involved in methoxymalonyl-ACP biosynthesis
MSFALDDRSARIVDLVLSCRVMGRRVEEAMLYQLLREAKLMGASKVAAEYLPTQKNGPCLKFLERSGAVREGNLFSWDVTGEVGAPQHIAIESSSPLEAIRA